MTNFSITNNVPLTPSSVEKPSSGGSRVIDTFSSLCLKTGRISEKEAGVLPVRAWCSSGVANGGSSVIVVHGIVVELVQVQDDRDREGPPESRAESIDEPIWPPANPV